MGRWSINNNLVKLFIFIKKTRFRRIIYNNILILVIYEQETIQ